MPAPLFQHRHYRKIAEILAECRQDMRDIAHADLIGLFAYRLVGTNPNFDRARFLAAAMGEPINGRDGTRRQREPINAGTEIDEDGES
jgi:hypothetical protein